jgi:hypothetical protein
MNKNDWIYLGNFMWKYAERNEGTRYSRLLKELIYKINTNMEMIINENEYMDESLPIARINGEPITDSTDSENQ